MPPEAIASRVRWTMASDPASLWPRWCRRSRSRRRGWGNFGAEPNPPWRGSKMDARRSAARGERVRGSRGSHRVLRRVRGPEPARDRVRERVRLPDDVVAPRVPCLDDGLEHLAEGRHAVPSPIGEVRAGEERQAFRCGEHAHRPAPAAGRGLHGLHVDGIDVRALLPVYLHAHEVPVHDLGDRRVRERLVPHDVTPMARGVADRDEEGPVELLRAREGVVSPRVPVDGIAGVLAQIGARLGAEPVHPRSPPGRYGSASMLRNLWSEL